MFEKKTMIVIGAGASAEVGLPIGHDLRTIIASSLNFRIERNIQTSGDKDIFHALQFALQGKPVSELNLHLEAAGRIRRAMPQAISIDNFIDANQGDLPLELCGKLAIVQSILHAERRSPLYVNEVGSKTSLKFEQLEQTWFNAFFQLLTENCTVNQVEERLSLVRLIVFNYDRCIEHYLYYALQNYYNIDAGIAGSLVDGMEIYHPYGTVGNLPWYSHEDNIDFGAQPLVRELLNLANQIKTFAEGTDPDSSEIAAIRAGANQSQIVLFLGFAFHRLNLNLIWPSENKRDEPMDARFYCTAIGISNSDCDTIRKELSELSGASPEQISFRNELTCFQLFQEYKRVLSMSLLAIG